MERFIFFPPPIRRRPVAFLVKKESFEREISKHRFFYYFEERITTRQLLRRQPRSPSLMLATIGWSKGRHRSKVRNHRSVLPCLSIHPPFPLRVKFLRSAASKSDHDKEDRSFEWIVLNFAFVNQEESWLGMREYLNFCNFQRSFGSILFSFLS